MAAPVPRSRLSGVRPHQYGGEVKQIDSNTYSEWNTIWEWTLDELLVSETHHKHHGVWDGGGPFLKWKTSVSHSGDMDFRFIRWGSRIHCKVAGVSPVSGYYWGQVPNPRDVERRPSRAHENIVATAYGPEAYRKTRPGNPVASVGQFLGEVEQLPAIPFKSLVRWPKIRSLAGVPFRKWGVALWHRLRDFVAIERRLGTRQFMDKAYRGLRPGGEFLNVQFGWKPFLDDLVSALELTLELENELAKLARENGKGIHRRTTLKKEQKIEDYGSYGLMGPFEALGGGAYAPSGAGVVGSTTHSMTRKTEERVWFSGKYRYWIPDLDTPLGRAKAIAGLYGALPTPSLVWELTPFSWLVDWFSNVGDTINNVSANAVENLVLEYGFIMRTWKETYEATAHVSVEASDVPNYHVWPAMDKTFRSTFLVETKSRARCLPFFPGAQPWVFEPGARPPFSGTQWAILVALGLSQGVNR